MSIKRDIYNFYRNLPPGEKARLWLKYHIEEVPAPTDFLSDLSETERKKYERSRIMLTGVHMFGDVELSKIEAAVKEIDFRYLLHLQMRQMVSFVIELKDMLRLKVKEPLTASEHAKLLDEAEKDRFSLHQLVEVLLEQPEYYGSPGADTEDRYSAAWGKKEKELKELVASGELKSEQTDGEVYIRWGDWCTVSGEELEPMIDGAAEGRVFPDEMADLVEEMRQERADLGELIHQPYADLMEDGGSFMTCFLSIIAPGLPSVPSGPLRPRAVLELARDTLASELRECWRRLPVIKRVFERLGEEEFDGRDIYLESPILEKMERIRLMASELGGPLGVEENEIEVDEDSASAILRGLVGEATPLG